MAGPKHLIRVAVEAALGKRREVVIFGTDYATPDGTGVRDYVHVTDTAYAHVSALKWLVKSPKDSMTLNCGSGHGHSVLEVLDAVERITRTRIARRLEPRRIGDAQTLVADNSRIVATLNWKPRFTELDTIISHAYIWERTLS